MARYSFWSMSGVPAGAIDTDNLREAVATARELDCEIYDNELKWFAYRILDGHFRWDTDWVLAMTERKQI